MTNGMAGERGERPNKNVERGQATRAHVIEVATRLFAEHGYDGTSVEAVQASSGVSRGSLYHHFPGKEALFLAVMEEVGARIGGQGRGGPGRAAADRRPAVDQERLRPRRQADHADRRARGAGLGALARAR